jgi:hypothetical protein
MAYQRKPLDGCLERVRRADEHLADFKTRIDTMFRKQANAVGINFASQPPYHVKGPTLPTETFYDMRFPVLIGEICYNLRTALDWLIFELAKLDTGVEQDSTQFPLEDTPDGFARNKKRFRIDLLTPAHVTLIEAVQPYKGCNWSKRLRDYSNLDKHREFVSTMGKADYHVHSGLEKDLSRCLGYERYTPHPVGTWPPVKVKVYISGCVTFTDGAPVIETIEEIKTGVADTLRQFEFEFWGRGGTPMASPPIAPACRRPFTRRARDRNTGGLQQD